MHTLVDYSKRITAAFDAVEDIKDWLGRDKWDKISAEMAKVKDCGQFAMYARLAGIHSFPVKAWYEVYHGQGSWKQEELDNLN